MAMHLKNKGFTIIEILIAIFIVVVGLISVYGLTQKILRVTHMSTFRLEALYLAQEGLELVRNVRDANYINGNDWQDGFTEGGSIKCGGEFELDYRSEYKPDEFKYISCYTDKFLKLESTYDRIGYEDGTDTIFKRKIFIENMPDNGMKVTSEVTWQEKGVDYNFSVEETLYEWR
jgi:prepilin-type N-terminal cleavage/methylation domain-containing protein